MLLLSLVTASVGSDGPGRNEHFHKHKHEHNVHTSRDEPPKPNPHNALPLLKPLRVFVLAGQSNMVGHGIISDIDNSTGLQWNATLEWLVANDPDQFGKLKKKQPSGIDVGESSTGNKHNHSNPDEDTWAVRQDVLIACNARKAGGLEPIITSHGKLTAGLCAGDPEYNQFHMGPELGFGWAVGDALNNHEDEKILLLKVAWGGKSLAVDFRPPSSGGTVGPYYESMITNVKNTLANLTNIFPDETVAGGNRPVHLSGFAWHQGWNDGCDHHMAKEYKMNLVHLIRDVRKDLGVPDLPFGIAATGMIGYKDSNIDRERIVKAEMKVPTFREFQGNVVSVDTRPFARKKAPASPSGQGYHWYQNAESYWLIGQSLGNAMVDLVIQREQGINAQQRVRGFTIPTITESS